MSAGWSIGHATTFWASRQATSILQYPVSLRREQQLADRRRKRVETMQDQEDTFVRVHRLQHTQQRSIIETSEAEDLEFWAKYQSWTFCANGGQLDPRKLLPPFRKRTATPLFTNCKCSRGTYEVPSTDDVPLILRRLTVEDQRLLSPFDVHCGDYRRIFNGYRQRTGPFRVSWSLTPVRDRIDQIVDEDRRDRVLNAYYYLLNSAESPYCQFVRMQLRGERRPFLYEIYSSPRYRGVECALWPALYLRTSLCESVLEGQNNRASSKIEEIPDQDRRDRFLDAYLYLLNSPESSYSQFVRMQLRAERKPFPYEIFSSPRYRGIECALWPVLYFRNPCAKASWRGRTTAPAERLAICISSCHL